MYIHLIIIQVYNMSVYSIYHIALAALQVYNFTFFADHDYSICVKVYSICPAPNYSVSYSESLYIANKIV